MCPAPAASPCRRLPSPTPALLTACRPTPARALQEFEEPPTFVALRTIINYILLIIWGHIQDFLRRVGLRKAPLAADRPEHKVCAGCTCSARHTPRQQPPGKLGCSGLLVSSSARSPKILLLLPHSPPPPPPLTTQDFPELYRDFESFYTRNLYRRIRDAWNRPICRSAFGHGQARAPNTTSLPHRQPHLPQPTACREHMWTLRSARATTTTGRSGLCLWKKKNTHFAAPTNSSARLEIPSFTGKIGTYLNLGSYNYLGFAENNGPCLDAAVDATRNFGVSLCHPTSEFGAFQPHALQIYKDLLFYPFPLDHNRHDPAAPRAGGACCRAAGPGRCRVLWHGLCRQLGQHPGPRRQGAVSLPRVSSAASHHPPPKASVLTPCCTRTPPQGCLILSDELNHTSIVLGARLSGAKIRVFRHNGTTPSLPPSSSSPSLAQFSLLFSVLLTTCAPKPDMAHLEQLLRTAVVEGQERTHRPWRKILICVEGWSSQQHPQPTLPQFISIFFLSPSPGVYSMEGSIVNLPAIIALKKKYKAYVYLDEVSTVSCHPLFLLFSPPPLSSSSSSRPTRLERWARPGGACVSTMA